MAKHNLITLKYNNYYNRIIKKLRLVNDYIEYDTTSEYHANINFVPNDGVSTQQVLNTFNIDHDYLVAEDDDTGKITRWFIIEKVRTRTGQYQLTLRRDIIADNYDEVITAPMFIEKATLTDMNDPAIYNAENMTFNQIKIGERFLKDDSQIPWIVGYVARPVSGQENPFKDKTITTRAIPGNNVFYEEVEGISNWRYYNKIKYSNLNVYSTLTVLNNPGEGYDLYTACLSKFSRGFYSSKVGTYSDLDDIPDVDVYLGGYIYEAHPYDIQKFNNLKGTLLKNILNADYYNRFESYIDDRYSTITPTEINAITGKLIKDSASGRVYRVIVNTETINQDYGFMSGSDPLVYLKANVDLNSLPDYKGAIDPDISWGYHTEAQKHTITLEEVYDEILVSFGSERDSLTDQPFDMFCIPAGNIRIKKTAMDSGYTCRGDIAIRVAQTIMNELGSAVYDVQLLPYCPVQSMMTAEYGVGAINIAGTKSVAIDIIKNNIAEEVSRLIWCTTSKFSFLKEYEISVYPTTVLDKKVRSLTQKYRICSPNYSAAFDIDPMKNNGIQSYQIDCMYKPFTPYIHVAPVFNAGSLYGGTYNDARGLICGGDFSIARVDSAWTQYKLQNINYEKTFQRQIENLETVQDIERAMSSWNILAGSLQGAGTGAAVGSAGGPWGAAIGGAVGGVASLAGGLGDYYYGEQLRDEAKSLQVDMYGYQMGNIKAIPNTISKLDAFDPNNKIFPFIEIYDCTETEREALKNKLKYNGMSVGRIGTINEFLQDDISYIKGQLIRLSVGEFHETNAIAGELSKGVFI